MRFRRKIFRNATHFVRINTKKVIGMYRRVYEGSEFLACLNHPESLFFRPDAILKNGGSSTVIRVKLDDRDWVIKRYNLKNKKHFLRRIFRKTRAYLAWYAANKLDFFNISTPLPAAFIEKKYGCFRTTAYYISEYIPGIEATEYFNKGNTLEKKMQVIRNMVTLFKELMEIKMTHGDLKLSNILLDQYDQPFLIDLDHAGEHLFLSSLQLGWQKDIQRFLRNFKRWPKLHQKVREIFYRSSC